MKKFSETHLRNLKISANKPEKREAVRKFMTGETSPSWKGGRTITPCGYVLVKAYSHPRKNPSNYVFEHILVAEATIGRYLLKGEHVHHINEIKNDNRPENLIILSSAEHQKLHAEKYGFVDKCVIDFLYSSKIYTQSQISKIYGIHESSVTRYARQVKGLAWRRIQWKTKLKDILLKE